MEKMFQLVLLTSLYASVVGISIIVLKTLLKDKISPKWHYFLWIILIVKLIIPFGPESNISVFNKVPNVTTNISIIQPTNEVIDNRRNEVDLNEQINITFSQSALNSRNNTRSIKFYTSYVWLIGILLMICWLFYTNYSLYLKLKKYNGTENVRINMIFKEAKREMNAQKNIRIIFQPMVNTPALFGVINPKILLPIEILDLTDKEISYILLHELAHYKRKDILANYILLIFQVVHWFNPIIWFCFKKIREDMEIATDEKVLKILEGSEHREYGKALLKVLESLSNTRFSPRIIGMVDDKKNMERRIKMIKMADFFKSKRRIIFIIGLLCIMALGSILLTSGKTKNEVLFEEKTSIVNDEKTYINSSNLKVLVYPKKYVPTMSISPGIKLQLELEGEAVTIHYNTSKGSLNAWDRNTGNIKSFGNKVILPYGIYAYWSPVVEDGSVKEVSESIVEIQVYNKSDKLIAEKEIKIEKLPDRFYSVVPGDDIIFQAQINNPRTVEEAVHNAVLGRESNYGLGEVATEGHIILLSEENDRITKVYTIASYNAYGFENGVFTAVSGSGAIPTVITFTKNDKNEYILKEYKEPMDGAGYNTSIKKMFPKSILNKILNRNDYPEIRKQQEEQALKYLDSIGRKAEVSSKYVERKLSNINVEASNKLFSEYTKFDRELNNFPYWLGTREEIQDGIRYIYETSQSRTSDGYDLITFRKTKEDETLVKEYKYKIVGREPELIK